MFKKILPLIAVTSSLLIAGQANAAVVAVAGSALVSSTNCPALSNTITVQLSTNVIGAYNCDNTSFVAATCASKGTLKLQSVSCQYDGITAVVKDGYDGCPGTNAEATAIVDGGAAWPKTNDIQSRLGYAGGSGGGQVAAAPMGLECDSAGLTELLPDSDLSSGASESEE